MLVISTVVVAVVGGAFAFVPQFRSGVGVLGANVRDVLSTGSFAGLGLANVGTGWDARQGQTGAVGGAEDTSSSSNPYIHLGEVYARWLAHYPPDIAARIQQIIDNLRESYNQSLLASQESGEAPPTGIEGNVCGQWAVSFVASMLGVAGVTLQNAIEVTQQYHLSSVFSDEGMTAMGLRILTAMFGMSSRYSNSRNRDGSTKTFGESRDWLLEQLKQGRFPAVLVSRNGRPHWMVVLGTRLDEFGRVIGFRLRDSISPDEQEMSNQEFDTAWSAHARESVSIGNGHGYNLFLKSAQAIDVNGDRDKSK